MIFCRFSIGDHHEKRQIFQLITAIRELDHHQRKLLNTALNQLSDEPKVLELIASCFDA